MITFILSLIAGLICLIAIGWALTHDRHDGRSGAFITAVVSAVVGSVLLFISLSSIVPTKHVGIPVTFGSPGKPLSNGFHFTAPWTRVVMMDGTIQDADNAGDNPVLAKDADDAEVHVHTLVRWSIQTEAADSLYRDYRDFDRIDTSLVQPEIRTAIASVMASYAPLEAEQPSNDEVAQSILARLQERVGDRVQIHSVSISLIDFSDATTDRINALNSERANTRVAEQRAKTAEQEAAANHVLAESLRDPNVTVANCIRAVSEAPAGTFPSGFQCFPGAGGGVITAAR